MSKKLTLDFILSKANANNPKSIRALNLRGNKIFDISILSELSSLEIISLDANQIKDISAFKKLKNVREVQLRDNQITDFNQLENLKNCKKLEKLAIKDNPIANISNYHQKIIEILPQLKKIDDIEVKQLKSNNNNFNSPLSKKDSNSSNIINNNYNIQSPNFPKNNLSNKSGSESISSDRKGEGNVSAAPDPQTSLSPPHLDDNLNIDNYNANNNNGINIIESYNAINLKLNNKKDKSELLNRSFKKKITEGSFRKVKKNKNNLNNIISQEEKKKQLLERANKDNKLKVDKLSQTLSSGFYKNPIKNNIDGGNINEIGGYKKKIIGNFKQEQEHKENNKNKQNVINTVFKKYNFFDNDNENEEEKKKNIESPKKNNLKNNNKLNPLISATKKNESLEKRIYLINQNNLEIKKNENKIIENGKEENINRSVVDSIKMLMTTLSLEVLKQIQNDVQKLIESKNKN